MSEKRKKMTEAGASVCLILATALLCNSGLPQDARLYSEVSSVLSKRNLKGHIFHSEFSVYASVVETRHSSRIFYIMLLFLH